MCEIPLSSKGIEITALDDDDYCYYYHAFGTKPQAYIEATAACSVASKKRKVDRNASLSIPSIYSTLLYVG